VILNPSVSIAPHNTKRFTYVVTYGLVCAGSCDRMLVKSISSFIQPPCCYFTLHKELFSKVTHFPKIYTHTSVYDPTASSASVDPTSQVCSSAILVIPSLKKIEYYDFNVVSSDIKFIPDFIKIRPSVEDLAHEDRETWPVLHAFVRRTFRSVRPSCDQKQVPNSQSPCTLCYVPCDFSSFCAPKYFRVRLNFIKTIFTDINRHS
jgi:hypothetical protein